jgi:hypothetical protein
MMLALGFGSEVSFFVVQNISFKFFCFVFVFKFSIVESVMILLKETLGDFTKRRLYDIIMRGGVCFIFFILGLVMTTDVKLFVFFSLYKT